MNQQKYKSIKRVFAPKIKERIIDPLRSKSAKSFEKKPKVHVLDKAATEKEDRNRTQFREDEEMDEEEKLFAELLKDMDRIEDLDEADIIKTRELHRELPRCLTSSKANGGFFTCIYCFRRHRGWYYHRKECPSFMGYVCNGCDKEINLNGKESHDLVCSKKNVSK